MPLGGISARMALTREVFGYQYQGLLATVGERGFRGESLSSVELRALWREGLEPPDDVRSSRLLMLQWTLLFLRSWNPLVFWASIMGGAIASATMVYKWVHAFLM